MLLEMKTVAYSRAALNDLRRHAGRAKSILSKFRAYAATGAGDVKTMKDSSGKRLRIGDFRAIFEETVTEILVHRIGHRATIYK